MPAVEHWMTSIGCCLGAMRSWPKNTQPGGCSAWLSSPSAAHCGPLSPAGWDPRYGVLICSLSAEQVLTVLGRSRELAGDPVAGLLAYVTFYDLRGGGLENSLKGDKGGLGLTKRNQKR